MRTSELAGDTTADADIEPPADTYAEIAPDDYQAAALVDASEQAPPCLDERDDEALERLPSLRRMGGDVVVDHSVNADDVPGSDLQFTPTIPKHRVRDVTPNWQEGDIQPDPVVDKEVKTERLEIDSGVNEVVLKELGSEDAERIVELVQFDTAHFTSVGEDVPEVAGSVEDVQLWLAGLKSNMPEGWDRVELGIWHHEEMVGCTGYAANDSHAYVWNWVGKAHTGHGYGGDSLRTLVPHLLSRGRSVIEARVREDNVASRRNMQKTGFLPVDKQHEYIRYRYEGQNDPAHA